MVSKILINNEMELFGCGTWGRLEKFYLSMHRMPAVNYYAECNFRPELPFA